MSIPQRPTFDPPPYAARAFRDLFNDWRLTPLGSLPAGGDVHATWQRGSDEFHITTQLPGDIRIHDRFKINE